MRSENMAKITLNAVRLPKFEPVNVVAELDHVKRFTATFRAGVILRMRREPVSYTHLTLPTIYSV